MRLAKTRNNNGRGVYGLTATPVTNSPIEVFNMLSLVAPKEDFERMGVRTVDDFVRQFGAVEGIGQMFPMILSEPILLLASKTCRDYAIFSTSM